MVRIRHIAIRTPDPEKTAAFYKDVLGLKEVGQARTGYYLSDGHINLAILKSRDERTGEKNRMMETVFKETDAARRKAAWERVQQLFYEDAGRIKFGDYFSLDVARKDVRNFAVTPELFFWNAWLAR